MRAVVALLLLSALSCAPETPPETEEYLTLGGAVPAPYGCTEWHQREPEAAICSYYFDAQEHHHRLKQGFVYTDEDVEHWEMPGDLDAVHDDCDAFAIGILALLRQDGWLARLVLADTEKGERHLLVQIGRYGVDNRWPKVLRMEELEAKGYRFLSASGYGPEEPWRAVLH